MAAFNHSEKQVLTYFIHRSHIGPHFSMHLGRTFIYGGQPVYTLTKSPIALIRKR